MKGEKDTGISYSSKANKSPSQLTDNAKNRCVLDQTNGKIKKVNKQFVLGMYFDLS